MTPPVIAAEEAFAGKWTTYAADLWQAIRKHRPVLPDCPSNRAAGRTPCVLFGGIDSYSVEFDELAISMELKIDKGRVSGSLTHHDTRLDRRQPDVEEKIADGVIEGNTIRFQRVLSFGTNEFKEPWIGTLLPDGALRVEQATPRRTPVPPIVLVRKK
jgi:hypothetical protein